MAACHGLQCDDLSIDLGAPGIANQSSRLGFTGAWTLYSAGKAVPVEILERYRDDVIAFLDREAPVNKVVLGGHSMGATVALMVAGARPDKVAGLVLVDPVILPPEYYMAMHLSPFRRGGGHAMARQARRRRKTFDSREHIQNKYKGRGAFATWRDPFLEDYVLDAFDRIDGNDPDSDQQTWQLLCDPKWEAATFMAQRNRPWSALAKVKAHKIPITVMRPDRDSVMTDVVAARFDAQVPAFDIEGESEHDAFPSNGSALRCQGPTLHIYSQPD